MKDKRNSGFVQIIIIILVVLAIIAGVYYFGTKNKVVVAPVASVQPSSSPLAKPTADPTANWKTYTNTQYGFSFKYPENQFNKENPIKGNPSGCQRLDSTVCVNPERYEFGVIKSCSNFECEDLIDVAVYLDPNGKSYQYFFLPSSLSYGQSLRETAFGGLPAKKYIYTTNPTAGQMYLVTTDKYGYVIGGDFNDSVTDQILSTFKFTN